MGLYGTLGLVGALALSALLAVWLFYSRSRRENFPEDTWDPYLGKKEDEEEGPGEGVEDISGAPAGSDSLSSRLQGLEAIPSNVEEEEEYEEKAHREADLMREQRAAESAGEAVELIGGEPISSGGEPEEIGAPVPVRADIGPSDPDGGGIPGGRGPAPVPHSGEAPWWEGVSSPGDVSFRRTVAELMGVGIAEPPPRENVVARFPGLSDEEIAPEEGEAALLPDISREISLASEDAAASLPDISREISLASEDAAAGDEPAEPPAPASFEDDPSGDESADELAEPPSPVSFEDDPSADKPAEPPSLVSLSDEVEPISEQVPVSFEDDPSGDEEDSFTLESLVLEDDDEADAPVMYEPEQVPGALEEETAPPAADDFQPDLEGGEETPLVSEEEEGGREFFDAEEAQEIPAGLKPAEATEPPGAGPEEMMDEPAAEVLDPDEMEEAPAEAILASEEIAPEEIEEEGPVLDSSELELDPSELEDEPAGALLDAEEMEEEPPEVSPQAPAEEEGGGDVFSVIERERSETPEEMPLEPIGNAALFEEMADEESPAENAEAPPPEAVRDFQAPGESTSLEEEEEETSFAEALESSFASPEGEPPGAPSASGEAVSGEVPLAPKAAGPPLAEAPLAAVSLEGDSAGEMIQNFISEYCPNELLLIEKKPLALPAGLEELAASAWSDIRERIAARQEVGAEEILRIGIMEQMIGRFDEALARLKEALRRADRMGPVLNALGVASHGRGKTDPAISYCKEAMREAGTDVALTAAVNRNLAVLYQTKGEYERAAGALVSAIKCSGSDESPRSLGGLHLRAGQLFRRLGEAESARHHLSESAHLFLRAGDDAARIRSLIALSAAQTELRDFDAALKNLSDAALLCRSEGDRAGEALVFGQMGIAYSAQDQYTRALEHYEKAIGLNRELGNRKGEGANLSNIGNIHCFRGDLEEARTVYEEALAINREEDHLIGQATILGNLGRIHIEQGLIEEAGERLNESQNIFRSVGAQEQLESIRELLDELNRSRER
jgi:tetratricopeptide (TPR) repeat protein